VCQTIKTSNGGIVASVEATTTLLGQVADMNASNRSTALFRNRIQRCSWCMPGGSPSSGCWTVYFKRLKAPRRCRWVRMSVTLTSGSTSCSPMGKVGRQLARIFSVGRWKLFVSFRRCRTQGTEVNLAKGRHGARLDGGTVDDSSTNRLGSVAVARPS
jgi:hypothetical protein